MVKDFSSKNVAIKILNEEMNNEYTGNNSLLLKNYPSLQFTSMECGLKKLYEYKKENLEVVYL